MCARGILKGFVIHRERYYPLSLSSTHRYSQNMTAPIILLVVAVYAGLWKVFEKAGIPGWKAIIPVYNTILLLQIAGRPGWWLLILLIPGVNIVIVVMISLELAECFGRGYLFGAGLVLLFFVFLPVLGFGNARYAPPDPR
jgi:hypothetical protein